MAKKKVGSEKNKSGLDYMYSPTIHIEFDSLSEIQDVDVGQEVYIIVRGTVSALSMHEGGGKEPSSTICLENFEAEILEGKNELQKLFEDEEDD